MHTIESSFLEHKKRRPALDKPIQDLENFMFILLNEVDYKMPLTQSEDLRSDLTCVTLSL